VSFELTCSAVTIPFLPILIDMDILNLILIAAATVVNISDIALAGNTLNVQRTPCSDDCCLMSAAR